MSRSAPPRLPVADSTPFGVLMSIALYFVMTRMMPPEIKEVPGGRAAIRKSLAELGRIKSQEFKLLVISLTLLGFWAIKACCTSSTRRRQRSPRWR